MKTKKILSCLLASVLICGTFSACGSEDEKTSESSATEAITEKVTEEVTEKATEVSTDESPVEASKTPAPVETVDVEEVFDAGSGDAYLAIVDGEWWIQYWGSSSDEGYMLAYDAGVTPITGNGDYSVSVTADTNGFRLDALGDANGEYVCSGVSFMSVMIKDGVELFPNAVITVNEILIDGNPIDLTSKAYTSTDDGIELRANLYNEWCNGVPSNDARSVDGALYDADGNPTDACADYSPIIFDKADMGAWSTVEVNFTVSGIE